MFFQAYLWNILNPFSLEKEWLLNIYKSIQKCKTILYRYIIIREHNTYFIFCLTKCLTSKMYYISRLVTFSFVSFNKRVNLHIFILSKKQYFSMFCLWCFINILIFRWVLCFKIIGKFTLIYGTHLWGRDIKCRNGISLK